MRRGCYLALEGVEGAGKTTVADALVGRLEAAGHGVLTVREPGGTQLGEEIRRLLLHSGDMTPWAEALLFAAQRAQLAAEVVAPALAGGTWVISDRSYYSSLAYQGGARRLGIDEVKAVNEAGLDGVVPDIVIVLEVSPEVGLSRQDDPDRIGGQGVDFQHWVAEAYREVARREPNRVAFVPVGGTPENVADAILAIAAGRGWR